MWPTEKRIEPYKSCEWRARLDNFLTRFSRIASRLRSRMDLTDGGYHGLGAGAANGDNVAAQPPPRGDPSGANTLHARNHHCVRTLFGAESVRRTWGGAVS